MRNRRKGFCTYCEQPVSGRRQYWCGEKCVHEYRVRTSAQYVRTCLSIRDYEVCAKCGFNARMFLLRVRSIFRQYGRMRPGLVRALTGRDLTKPLWEADHIEDVRDGNGACGLDNFQTLCRRCHLQKTSDSLAKRPARRKRSR